MTPEERKAYVARLKEAEQKEIKDLMLIQPNNVTFGSFSLTSIQDNILTLITEQIQNAMTTRTDIQLDSMLEPYIDINCDEAGGARHKERVLKEAKALSEKSFTFRWQVPGRKGRISTTGTIITTIHDYENSSWVRLNFNKWAIPFLLYYGQGVGGTIFSKQVALQLRGNVTKRIYKFLMSQKDRTRYEYPLNKFIEDYEIPLSYTPSMIKTRFLDKAVAEIKRSESPVWFDYEMICKHPVPGRKQKADTIVFEINNMKPEEGTDQAAINNTVYRWVYIVKSDLELAERDKLYQKIIVSRKRDLFYQKCNYYDDLMTSGKMPAQKVYNILNKIIREEFEDE